MAPAVDDIARELAAKIHNMNNAWQAVLGVQLVIPETTGKVRERLERLLRAARLGATLGRESIVLATQLASRRTEVDLNEMLQHGAEDAEDLLVARGIRVLVTPAPEPLWTRLNREGFAEAIHNLAANAGDAMPNGGTFHLSAVLQDQGRMVCIQARDEGVGMEPAVAARCFEEFYTTKGATGTGLGLFTVRRFVEAHGGRVRLDTTPGKGTMLELCFPRTLEGTTAART
jgi:signal transduction histidine kinase